MSDVSQPLDFLAMEGQYRPLDNNGVLFYYKNDYQGAFGDVQVTTPAMPRPEAPYDTAPTNICLFVQCGPVVPPPYVPPPVIPYVPPPIPLPACVVPEPGTLQLILIFAVLMLACHRWIVRMI
jgi:hypothetical protein